MKKLFYVLIGIVVLYIILAFIGPKHVKVERQVTINKPASAVIKEITDFKSFHEDWSPWTEKDTAMTVTYRGNAGEIGHHHTWKGNKDVGAGSMTLMKITSDSVIQKLSFEGEGDSEAYYVLNESNNTTVVTWGIMFDIGFFRRPPMLFLNMDKMMGGDFESGLNKLKNVVESKASDDVAKYDIKQIEWPAVTYVGKKETVMFADMSAFFGKNFGAIMSDKAVKPLSSPSGIYSNYDENGQKSDVVACVKVEQGTKTKNWETFSYPASKVLHIAYYGSYEKSMAAHMQMGEYMKQHDLKEEVVIEEYVTDPMSTKDTSQWLTNIYYVLK